MCAGRVATPARSLAAMFPKIAREWHPTRNGGLTPTDVLPRSHRKVWWRCRKDPTHEWAAMIGNRTARPGGCTICSNRKVTPTNSLASRFPALAAEWHPTKNGRLRPEGVVPGTARTVWWRCSKDPSHTWRARIVMRVTRGHACPQCRTLLARFPELSKEWHPTKNGRLTPADVTYGACRKVWWRCKLNPAHEWRASPNARTRPPNGRGCPECARANRLRRLLRGTARAAPDPALRGRRRASARRSAA
jgi:hypothetical protein